MTKKITRKQYETAQNDLSRWQAVEMRERNLGHARKASAAMSKAVKALAIIARYKNEQTHN